VKKIVALHIEEPPTERDGAIVFQEEDAFLLPYRHRGHWLFSYTCDEWDVDPDAVEPGPTPAHLSQARELLERYAPRLADRCVSGRVFCDAVAHETVRLLSTQTPSHKDRKETS
jgi:hypothetical protein